MTENRGGAREGAGRKKKTKTISERIKKRWLAAANKLARETGMTIEYAALSMIYDENVHVNAKASILKTYNEALIIKETESRTEHTERIPQIYTPERGKDPALTVIDGGLNG